MSLDITNLKEKKTFLHEVKSYFKNKIKIADVKRFTDMIFSSITMLDIEIINPSESFLKLNKKRFDEVIKDGETKYILNDSAIEDIKLFAQPYLGDLKYDIETDDKNRPYINIDKNTEYDKLMRTYIEEECPTLKYDFIKSKQQQLKLTSGKMQHIKIVITSQNEMMVYPKRNMYLCHECGTETRIFSYKVKSSSGESIKCKSLVVGADGRSKMCGTSLQPASRDDSIIAYYFTANIIEGTSKQFSCFSFGEYQPGEYEALAYVTMQKKGSVAVHILDVKKLKNNVLVIPEVIEKENYIFSLIKSMDSFIKKKAHMDLVGVLPIKLMMMIQAGFHYCGFMHMANIQLLGDASTGKTSTMRYYGFSLYGAFCNMGNGVSTSIPGLRGSEKTIELFGMKKDIVTPGLLSSKHLLIIDEINQEPQLKVALKPFLADESYRYDKRGGQDTIKIRTAHVNITENLSIQHTRIYVNSIRKKYNELSSVDLSSVIPGSVDKPKWNERWDMFKPLISYIVNPWLLYCVNAEREHQKSQSIFWLDGCELAFHERFLFKCYLKDEKGFSTTDTMNDAMAFNQKAERNDNNLLAILTNNQISEYFDSIKKYKDIEYDNGVVLRKISLILNTYGISQSIRVKQFYFDVLTIIRMMNKRKNFTNSDFDVLIYFIENKDVAVDIADIIDFKIKGSKSHDVTKTLSEIDKLISDKDTGFGINEM